MSNQLVSGPKPQNKFVRSPFGPGRVLNSSETNERGHYTYKEVKMESIYEVLVVFVQTAADVSVFKVLCFLSVIYG